MESKAVDEQISMGTEATDSIKDLTTSQNSKNTSLPSPPSSVKATELDGDRNATGLLSGETVGNGNSISANGGTSAGIKKAIALIDMQADR